ncbi:hypothetical protein [Roseovarius aestuariivivens]|uniref:hypothetical protein n=1 Tax=Roseovarius aestuariivivens TaxID=1888910 RepID=UPI0010803D6F|nr:hypothetical protein [Roseovarius aestuariivivens]
MDPDLFFTIGIVLAVFSVPSIMSAFSEGRAPRVAAFTVIAAGAMVVWAIQTKPGGYAFTDIPDVFVRVVAKYLT